MGKKIGAEYLGDEKASFRVWAPSAQQVDLKLKNRKNPIAFQREESGYWGCTVSGVTSTTKYKVLLNGTKALPDPASKYQPEGVHSWSQLMDSNSYQWKDKAWKGISISEMLLYEVHVGTFSEEGTFTGIQERLDHLQKLGINTLELMPIAQFPGERNWGYDGVYPFSVQHSYGSPDSLKKLIDSCHERGMAVILDVVYNHLGPEGNYLQEFGPYFTKKYETPWGLAINFDDKYADEVRNFFLQNALRWLEEFHFDGLRLDAVHEIIDRGARHFLKELREEVETLQNRTGRSYVLIAESDLNDRRIIDSFERGGYGINGQWVDDFHHCLHTVLTEEKVGYYSDFGSISHLAKSLKQGFVYDGIYSKFRKRTIGNSPLGISLDKFVVSIQNHDQVGNRMLGDRLPKLVDFESLKLAAGTMLLTPFTPMLFMGEEFAETRNFQYFVNHGDPDLVKAVQEGRKREFEYFIEHAAAGFPDPQAEETFTNSKLNWEFSKNENQLLIFQFYQFLIDLRKGGAFNLLRSTDFQVEANEEDKIINIMAETNERGLCAYLNFSKENYRFAVPDSKWNWKVLLASAEKRWGGKMESIESKDSIKKIELSPRSLVLLEAAN